MLRKKLEMNSDPNYNNNKFWSKMYAIECEMNEKLKLINFDKPVAVIYNPIIYASDLHRAYLKKYLNGSKDIMMIGMNPGPWGMCQTGIPFGSIPAVRDWMQLNEEVEKPEHEHAERPVTGLNCTRIEESGKRFWGLMQHLSETPEILFEKVFIYNYCPLAFLHASGKNITPSELKGSSKQKLQEISSEGLEASIKLISPKVIISIGTYVKDRVNDLIKKDKIEKYIQHKCMPHPSPRSLNNTNWNEKAVTWLIENDLIQYFKKP